MPEPRRPQSSRSVVAIVLVLAIVVWTGTALAASRLEEFLRASPPAELFPGADRVGSPVGEPPIAPVFAGERQLGWAYLNSDFVNATGYSGKPIHLLVGIDAQGRIAGFKLVEHKEPIVLIGIPERRILEALSGLVGQELQPVATGATAPPQARIVSGATVTVLVAGDSIVRSAVRLIRSGRLGGTASAAAAAAPREALRVDMAPGDIRDWEDLLGDGSVRRLSLTIGEVSAAFARAGQPDAAANPEPGGDDAPFIDLYAALVSVPAIGRSLLGEEGYARLAQRLQPGQQAILVAGEGAYSFKGSGYVRGGIFDRIELVQEGAAARFRDRHHERLGAIAAEGAPELREIALFVTPPEIMLDPTQPWELTLFVQRDVGPRAKALTTFRLPYQLPDRYLIRTPVAQPAPPAEAAIPAPSTQSAPRDLQAPPMPDALDEPLWQRIWRGRAVDIAIAGAALATLTVIFFFQDWLVRRPRLYLRIRLSFLAFTLVWLGWYANAQLSVVNVLTFTNALVTGFDWQFFLAAPLIFVLWSAIAAALLFWGRGPFCGWLCPFGALQELLSAAAQRLGVPQLRVPWGLHERLWPIKYVIFLGLFGVSLYSVAAAEAFAEVEPFKTAIVLKFDREWPFVLYALLLLGAGLFVERFFCRYLCPLGAALAIPGRIRMFEWLKRWPDCGSPCQRCAKECPVQSIHPEGQINVNECIYCMHCQELYHDDQRCPHMIQVRLKRERRAALTSPEMRPDAVAPRPSRAPASGGTRTDPSAADGPTTTP